MREIVELEAPCTGCTLLIDTSYQLHLLINTYSDVNEYDKYGVGGEDEVLGKNERIK